MAEKSKTYELALKIAGKVDSSLKAACVAADKNLAAIGSTARTAGKVIAGGAIAGATAVGTLGVAAVKAGAEYETKLANISTLLTGTEAEVTARTGEIGKQILDVSNRTGVFTDNLTDGMYQVISAFGDSADAASQLEIAAKAAAAGNATTTDAVNLLSAVTKGYGDISAEAVQKAADLSFATVRLGQTSFPELAASIQQVTGASNILGVKQEELFGVFATATGVTGQTSQVATQLKAVYSNLEKPTTDLQKALNKLGYASGQAAIQDIGLQGTLDALSRSVNGDASAMAKMFSSAEGLNLVLGLTGDLSQSLTDKTAEMYTAAGATDAAFRKQTNTMQYTIREIKNLGANFLTQLGTNVLPYVKELAEAALPVVQEGLEKAGAFVVDTVIPATKETVAWVRENSDVLLALVAGIGAAVVAYKVAKTGMAAYNAAMAIYKVVTAASATGTFTLAGAMTALNIPMLAACAVIGLLVAGGILLYKNWDTVKEKAGELGAKIGEIWSNISNAVNNAISAISERFPLLGAYLQGWWSSIQDAWANVQAIFSNIISFIDNVFSGNWKAAWDNVIAIFGNAFGLMVNLAKAPINGVISAINWVLGKINSISITIPDWVPGVGGTTLGFKIPTIPQLAVGGIATGPTIAQIGEGGEPEAVLPLSKLADLLSKRDPKGPKPGHGGPGGDGVTFAPVFNFYGSPPTREEAMEAGRLSFAEFKRLYDRMKAEERRKKFSPA